MYLIINYSQYLPPVIYSLYPHTINSQYIVTTVILNKLLLLDQLKYENKGFHFTLIYSSSNALPFSERSKFLTSINSFLP